MDIQAIVTNRTGGAAFFFGGEGGGRRDLSWVALTKFHCVSMLLEMIDLYPMYISRRGLPPVPFLGKHIIITSSMRPEQVYAGKIEKEDNINQLLRRI